MKHFDFLFISWDKGCTKQDEEFYRIPAKETGYKPEEILLIDDRKSVLEEAAKAGWQTYHFISIEKFNQFIAGLLGKSHG